MLSLQKNDRPEAREKRPYGIRMAPCPGRQSALPSLLVGSLLLTGNYITGVRPSWFDVGRTPATAEGRLGESDERGKLGG
jgi:hypothetical protein